MAAEKREGVLLGLQDPEAKRARAAPGGESAEIQIPQHFVGWLKGAHGGQIREIEAKSGAQVSIDQGTKDLGYSRALLYGTQDAVLKAADIITNELRRVMERDNYSGQASPVAVNPGDIVDDCQIPQKYVGWLKGSGGTQIRDMETRTGTRVRIDQSTRESGFSIAQITGPPDGVRMCRGLIEAEVQRVTERDRVVAEHSTPGSTPNSLVNEVPIPQQYVGWIKGSGGAQIKDIEQKSGAHVTIDQSTQNGGYSRALVYGTDAQIQAAKEIIQGELSRVMQRDGGPPAGGLPALTNAPAAAGVVPGAVPGATEDTLNLVAQILAAAGLNMGGAAASPNAAGCGGGCGGALAALPAPAPAVGGVPALGGPPGEDDTVLIPNSCVGWLKGKQGAMIREIEGRSGAQIDIDQGTKDLGYSLALIRGAQQQRRTAKGLVIAEVAKVLDNSGEPLDTQGAQGTKAEFRIDTQFVGWVKGPRGKVVQDIQVRSGTRVDVDQTTRDQGFATVRIYGTLEGTQEARGLIASELSKISPESAAAICADLPGGYQPGALTPSSDFMAAPGASGLSAVGDLLGLSQPAGLFDAALGGGSGAFGQQASPLANSAYVQQAPALQAAGANAAAGQISQQAIQLAQQAMQLASQQYGQGPPQPAADLGQSLIPASQLGHASQDQLSSGFGGGGGGGGGLFAAQQAPQQQLSSSLGGLLDSFSGLSQQVQAPAPQPAPAPQQNPPPSSPLAADLAQNPGAAMQLISALQQLANVATQTAQQRAAAG